MPFDFALNINSDAGALSPDKGLDIKQLGPLAQSLGVAIDDGQNSLCTLHDIQNHGYTPHFLTESETIYNNFISVHRNIYERGTSDLSRAERSYANILKRVLKRDQYVQPLDVESKPICKIYRTEIKTDIPHFHSITNVTGIVSEIGGERIDQTTHILLHGLDYRIYITVEQDEQLSPYYKKGVIEFKLKQKRNTKNGQVTSARLITFKVKPANSLYDVLNGLQPDEIPLFNDPSNKDEFPGQRL
ncbi:MAG: hypothetical protein JST27_08085 [Bacteroidetes bacterium]|nr:hypothetical protein [Bacteroidota bacterium]